MQEYKCVSAIAGFELDEVIDGLYFIVKDLMNGNCGVRNVYGSVVRKHGNIAAQSIIDEFFQKDDDYWRGLGLIASSGYKLKDKYSDFDIEKAFPISVYGENGTKNGCQCGEVLKGKIRPEDCALFAKACTPESPIGPCMVSGEGSCAARFKYGNF